MIREAYGARLKDKQILQHSSSGGVFTSFARQCLNEGGRVVCTVYDYQQQKPHYVMIDTLKQLDQDHSTKYIQSDKGDIFRESASYLKQDPSHFILFTGTGCEAEGFRLFMQNKGLRDQVMIIDLICFGALSPQFWNTYQQQLQHKSGQLNFLNFRDKRNGWKQTCPVAICDQKEVLIYDFLSFYNQACVIRPSCYHCPFTKKERKSDITIGDFWGMEEVIPDFYDPSGTSVVLIHSEKGKQFFQHAADQLEICACDWDSVDQPRLRIPTALPEDREAFWNCFHKEGIRGLEKRRKRQNILKRGMNLWKKR